MTTDTLAPHLLDSLRGSTHEILETVVFVTPASIEAMDDEPSDFADEVIGLLGFTGTRSGTFVVRAAEQVARTIAAKMLMMEPEELGGFGEVSDAFGELVNMLSGNFKNAWVANGNQMELSVPNVIHNGSVRVNSDKEGCLRSRIRVDLGTGSLDIGIHFEAKD